MFRVDRSLEQSWDNETDFRIFFFFGVREDNNHYPVQQNGDGMINLCQMACEQIEHKLAEMRFL